MPRCPASQTLNYSILAAPEQSQPLTLPRRTSERPVQLLLNTR